MKTSTWAILCAVLLAVGLVAEGLHGEDGPKPGKEHQVLKQWEGTWDAVFRFIPEPGKPMAESKGVETASVGLGGFWLTTEFRGDMMGTPFTGRGTIGYDQQKQRYVGTWIDSMKSGLLVSEGTADERGRLFTMIAQGYSDAQGKARVMKQVMELKDKDSRTLTFLTPNPDGKDMVVGTIEYTRRK
ncbi:MAG TPA: DUF1579 domain-containing protein [Planctomycetota bacterium]|nr:DUF1579 domain-containing protein [Planctomycetota bacterium]